MNVRPLELMNTLCPNLRGCFDHDGWVHSHNDNLHAQKVSSDALTYLHQQGYKFDIVRNDDKRIGCVMLSDVNVKLTYNVNSNMESYPPNGIKAWRLSSQPYKPAHGTLLARETLEQAYSSSPYISDELKAQLLSPGRLTKEDFQQEIFTPVEPVGPFYANDKYKREIKTGVFIDAYDIIDCYEVTSSALQHALKKILATGKRGHKTYEEDLIDILSSVERALIQHREKEV